MEIYSAYKPIEVGQSTGTTDSLYNIGTAYSGSAKLLSRAYKMYFITDQTVTIKFGITTADPITVKSTDGIRYFENLEIENLYVTNASGSTSNLRIIFIGREKGL